MPGSRYVVIDNSLNTDCDSRRIDFFRFDAFENDEHVQNLTCTAGSIPTIGDFHTVGPCKKAVFACLATDVK